jgi:hypothetical protein
MSTPKNVAEADRRLRVLKEEYLVVRGKNPQRAKAVATEIYALQEWIVANARRK